MVSRLLTVFTHFTSATAKGVPFAGGQIFVHARYTSMKTHGKRCCGVSQ